eukprot:12520529-Alexandrium_andersonii.AAC.1
MCGGAFSPAARVRRPLSCPACGEGIADLYHLYWACPAAQALRCVEAPSDPLARRMGWAHREVLAAASQSALWALRQT